MVTFVPKFNLPGSAKPEVVFIVDRSGCMFSRVTPLKSSFSSPSLSTSTSISTPLTLVALPLGNIPPYSNQSYEEAQKYCDRMKADFGGTEILTAIKSTIEWPLKDLNLEIMVLTDGEAWDENLFKYVEKETEKGDEFGY